MYVCMYVYTHTHITSEIVSSVAPGSICTSHPPDAITSSLPRSTNTPAPSAEGVCMCIYVCMNVRMHVYFTDIRIRMHADKHTLYLVFRYIHKYINTCMHAYIHTCVHT